MQIARVPLCLFRACTLTRNIVCFPLHLHGRDLSRPPAVLSVPPPSREASLPPRLRLPEEAYVKRDAGGSSGVFRDSLARKVRRDGTIISVDYAIIARLGAGGGRHLSCLSRVREGGGGAKGADPGGSLVRDLFPSPPPSSLHGSGIRLDHVDASVSARKLRV